MCLMQTDFPVPEGPRIIEILPSGRPMFRPLRILLRPKALCTSMNSTASGTPVGRLIPVCHSYSSGASGAGSSTTDAVVPDSWANSAAASRSSARCSASWPFSWSLVGIASAGGPPDSSMKSDPRSAPGLGSSATVHPPIGARGFAPQNTCVPSMPTRCTSTMLSTIDFAVAVPTPTGPPLAL